MRGVRGQPGCSPGLAHRVARQLHADVAERGLLPPAYMADVAASKRHCHSGRMCVCVCVRVVWLTWVCGANQVVCLALREGGGGGLRIRQGALMRSWQGQGGRMIVWRLQHKQGHEAGA